MEEPTTLVGLHINMAELYIGNTKIEGSQSGSDKYIQIPYGQVPGEYVTDQIVRDANLQGVTKFDDYSFAGANVSWIPIPNSVISLGDYCFYGSRIYCMDGSYESGEGYNAEGITSLGQACFKDCTNLDNINLDFYPNIVTMGAECFMGCSSAVKLCFPEDSKIEVIPEDCFNGCSSLSSVNSDSDNDGNLILPTGIRILGSKCFYGCTSITGIRIPSTVEQIGTRCFTNCESLETVYFEGNPPTLDTMTVGSGLSGNFSFKSEEEGTNSVVTFYHKADNSNWTAEVKEQFLTSFGAPEGSHFETY